jgi:hypothetical protein
VIAKFFVVIGACPERCRHPAQTFSLSTTGQMTSEFSNKEDLFLLAWQLLPVTHQTPHFPALLQADAKKNVF